MDSAFSNGQDDQINQNIGAKSPEYLIADKNDDESDELHRRLLFGGSSTTASSESTSEVSLPAVKRISGTSDRARTSTDELNLVSLSAVTGDSGTRTSVKQTASASTYESNPLPALAKLGIANTVALQTPTSDNVVPVTRRSGASDKIAVQLTQDAAAAPILTAVRSSDVDPEIKHQMVTASATDLFNRLGQTVPPGTKDTTTVTARNIQSTSDTDPYTGNVRERLPLVTQAAYRPATEVRADISSTGMDAGYTGGRRRQSADTTDGADGYDHGRPRSHDRHDSDNNSSPDSSFLPRMNRRQASDVSYNVSSPDNGQTDGPLLGIRRSSNSTPANIIGRPTASADDKGYPSSIEPLEGSTRPTRRVDGYFVTPGGTLAEIIAPKASRTAEADTRAGDVMRGVNQYLAPLSDKVTPVNEKVSPLTKLSTIIGGVTEATGVLPPVRTNPTNATTSDSLPNTRTVMDRSVTNSSDSTIGTRAGVQTSATVPIFKDGKIYIPVRSENLAVVPGSSTSTSDARPDSSQPRTRVLGDIGTVLTNGMKNTISVVNDNVNNVAKIVDPTSPRNDGVIHLPGRTDTVREVRNNDGTTTPGAGAIIGRNSEVLPVVKPVDGILPTDKQGKQVESANLPERTTARSAEEAVPGRIGDAINRGEILARGGEILGKNIEGGSKLQDPAKSSDGQTTDLPRGEHRRNNDGSWRNAESGLKPADATVKSLDGQMKAEGNGSSAKSTESGLRAANESLARNGENVAKNIETARNPESSKFSEVAKTFEGARNSEGVRNPEAARNPEVAKGIEVAKNSEAVKAVEVARIAETSKNVEGSKVNEGSKNVDGLRNAEQIIRSQDQIVRSQDQILRSQDQIVRSQDQVVRSQDQIASNGQNLLADKNVRLSDAVVKAADQNIQANQAQIAQNVLLNNQLIAAVQGNQAIIQPIHKQDGANADIAGSRVADQNQINAQNQFNNPNQIIAQNQNIGLNGKEQVSGHKVVSDSTVAANRVNDVKVDQVVADILNHVRVNTKDQQAGAKVISSLDQNNAANFTIEQKGLLDAAAVRRILDAQGIVLSPTTLNQLMEGIRPTGDHTVDYALPSIGSLNLSQIISLGERLQEAVAGAGNETSETQPKPQLQQHRTKYIVQEGDTLESIAEAKLGDARLFQLLITINRAQVNYKLEEEQKVAYVLPGQYLWLPTDHELEIHKRNFFGKQGKEGSFALGISSKQNTPLIPPVSFDRTREVSAEVVNSLHDFRPSVSKSNSKPNSVNGFNPLSGNRMNAGYEQKKSADRQKLEQAEKAKEDEKIEQIENVSMQVSHRQCYQVREGESLMSIAASLECMGHIGMWKLLAKINGFKIEQDDLGKPVENLFAGQFIVLPTNEELNEYKLLEKLTSCSKSVSNAAVANVPINPNNAFGCVFHQKEITPPPPPALIALAQGVGGLSTVLKLSSYTRIVLNDLPQLENCFSVNIETRWNGQWRAMASYECRHGQTTRHLFNKHGEIKSMALELPPYVVKEMAREDFIRNWNSYTNRFMGSNADSCIQS